ncbi:MAG: hypothetical protein IJU50_11280, partial [Lachnospiraceae bacterium]|nr:hypothetical protein [Lachnospiraceae bacterium]
MEKLNRNRFWKRGLGLLLGLEFAALSVFSPLTTWAASGEDGKMIAKKADGDAVETVGKVSVQDEPAQEAKKDTELQEESASTNAAE